jgi:hypothetical protein
MSKQEKLSYRKRIKLRYERGIEEEKGRILEEFCFFTGTWYQWFRILAKETRSEEKRYSLLKANIPASNMILMGLSSRYRHWSSRPTMPSARGIILSQIAKWVGNLVNISISLVPVYGLPDRIAPML